MRLYIMYSCTCIHMAESSMVARGFLKLERFFLPLPLPRFFFLHPGLLTFFFFFLFFSFPYFISLKVNQSKMLSPIISFSLLWKFNQDFPYSLKNIKIRLTIYPPSFPTYKIFTAGTNYFYKKFIWYVFNRIKIKYACQT